MNQSNIIEELRSELEGLSAVESLKLLTQKFPGKVVFSTALGQEDQVITHMIAKNDVPVDIFTLDTGRLFSETYDLLATTTTKYKLNIKTYFPNAQQVEEYVYEKGINGFYNSVEDRKQCCFVRKVEPLKRALQGAQVWVTGLRAGQSGNRQHMHTLEWDEVNQVIKYQPILNWSFEEMISYLKENKVPYNPLHDKGFLSIGCAPCTRAIMEGEDLRAGRWWWEASKKECGLHENHFQQKETEQKAIA